MYRRLILIVAALFAGLTANAQKAILDAFKPVTDSITVLTKEHFGVRSFIKLNKAMKRGNSLDLYFTKELGDYLIVAISTDEFNWNSKQKKCYFTYEQRKALVESIRSVDLVIPEENWEQKKTDCQLYHADVFVMGDDWTGKFDFLKEEGAEVVYLERTPEISTTQIKHDLNGK